MLSGTCVEHREESVEESVARALPPAQMPEAPQTLQAAADDSLPDDAAAFDPNEFENFAFDFGAVTSEIVADVEAGRPHDNRRDPRASGAATGSEAGAAPFGARPFTPA